MEDEITTQAGFENQSMLYCMEITKFPLSFLLYQVITLEY
jgi:hypothetical protein